jgi:hypothetical protein
MADLGPERYVNRILRNIIAAMVPLAEACFRCVIAQLCYATTSFRKMRFTYAHFRSAHLLVEFIEIRTGPQE